MYSVPKFLSFHNVESTVPCPWWYCWQPSGDHILRTPSFKANHPTADPYLIVDIKTLVSYFLHTLQVDV